MGTLEIYNKNQLRKINGKFIYDLVKSNISFEIIQRQGRKFPAVKIQFGSVDKMLQLKKALEYKYFLPIHYRWKYRELVFYGYSAYTLLKLIQPYSKFRSSKQKELESLIEETQDCVVPTYAAGAIESSPDKGVGYRKDLKKTMEFTKVQIVDPCDFQLNNQGENGDQLTLIEFAERNDILKSYFHTRSVVVGDCAAVIETECVVALIDQYIGIGTPSELTLAVAFNRPVYGILGEGMKLEDIHPWTRSCVSRYFSSMEELRNFIVATEV